MVSRLLALSPPLSVLSWFTFYLCGWSCRSSQECAPALHRWSRLTFVASSSFLRGNEDLRVVCVFGSESYRIAEIMLTVAQCTAKTAADLVMIFVVIFVVVYSSHCRRNAVQSDEQLASVMIANIMSASFSLFLVVIRLPFVYMPCGVFYCSGTLSFEYLINN